MASRHPLPEFLWSRSVETDHYKEHQPWKPNTSIDGAICEACKDFCESALHGNIFAHENWKHERPSHWGVTHIERYAWTSHYDGVLMELRASADRGCEMCALFVEVDRTSPKPFPNDTFPDEPADPEDICYRICIDRTEEGTLEVEATHSFAIEFYRKSTGPEQDDTDPRALYTESLFHEDPHRKVVVEQSGWPILLSADAEDRGSVQALMRARKWIWQCLKTHPRCSREAARLPKRVIDIGSTPDSPIRLHIPDPEDRIVTPYIALSYSWGTDLPLRTAKENLEKHCEEVPFEDFPRTLQDALHVTRGLGLRYIWIDALCIVQDDEPDWEEQAALMGEIYQGSVLNISATSSPSLSSGFLQRSGSVPSSRVRIGRYFHRDGVNHGGIYIGVFDLGGAFTPPSDLNESFLSSRGWVFQEQLMSTATLHYMDQEMVWECATTIRNERFADANAVITDPRLDGWTRLAPLKWGWINYLRSNKPDYFDRNRDGVLVPSAKNDEVFNVLMALWKEWIFDYSKRDLTYGKDRLPAIAGITQLISKKYRLHFTVGHFTQDMPLGLCWSPRRSRKVSLGGYQPNEAIKLPSWSWPSFPGGVWYSGSNKVHNLQITCSQSPSDLRILCYSFRTDGSSDVYAGTCLCIEVEGLLQDVQVEFTASSYYISTGVKVAHLRAYFDYPPPAEESPWQKYLLRVTGYNHKLYDLLVPFASEREKNVPGHEREPEVVSKLRQNPDNIWCLLLEEVLPSSESLRTFRRVGMADTDDRRSERGADVFVSPERLKMRLV